MEMERIVGILRRSELFLGLSDADLRKIAVLPSCVIRDYAAGERIFTAGDAAADFYILVVGRVSVFTQKSAAAAGVSERNVVGTATKGGTFGLSAFIPPPVRYLSAVTEEPATVLSIGMKELRALFAADAVIGYEVMQSLVSIIGAKFRNLEELIIAD
jgi:CRP-like cAMP-binding protein